MTLSDVERALVNRAGEDDMCSVQINSDLKYILRIGCNDTRVLDRKDFETFVRKETRQ